MGSSIAPRIDTSDAWYIRISDVPAFIRKITPVLEERLAQSVLIRQSGDLYVDFYSGGLHITFDQGKLTVVKPWRAPAFENPATAGFPPLIFLQLLLGYRSLEELRHFFPDVSVEGDTTLLIDTLFPKQRSFLMPMALFPDTTATSMSPHGSSPGPSIVLVEPLSDRELEVLHLMADGLKYQEIADQLIVSLNTVRSHMKNIYGKLGVNNRTQAISKANELHLL